MEPNWYAGTRCTIQVCTLRPVTLSYFNPSHTSIFLYFERTAYRKVWRM